MKIEKYHYSGKVYNIEVEPNHDIKDDQYYIDARNGVVVHNCHPRDNIALRWLAQEYGIGYDIFDTIMHAREIQARNLAQFLVQQASEPAFKPTLPIVIHGKAYKPDVPYCIGSYSTLIGHYVKELGHPVQYLDPLADDHTDVVKSIDGACVLLLAHNRQVTYGYTGDVRDDAFYCAIPDDSIIVDPWRRMPRTEKYTVIHYGNSRTGHRSLFC